MAWISFLKSKTAFDPATFEKDLSQISKKISLLEKTNISLSYSCKKLKNSLIIYGFPIYIVLVAYIFYHSSLSELRLGQIALIISVPVLLIASRHFIHWLYLYRIKNNESRIEILRNDHSSKIEELKELTKFQSTQNLLNRFNNNGEDMIEKLDDEIEQKKQQLQDLELKTNSLESKLSNTESKQRNGGWIGSIVDKMANNDEFNPNNRFALICVSCLCHNGLAPPGVEPVFVKYICPRCGQLNGADRTLSVKDEDAIKSTDKMNAEESVSANLTDDDKSTEAIAESSRITGHSDEKKENGDSEPKNAFN